MSPPNRSALPSFSTLVMLALAAAIAIALPLTGVWVASSLAAYSNRAMWKVGLAGLLLFPILPLAWDALMTSRRRRLHPGKPPFLPFGTRFVLRTVVINVAFLGGLLALRPALAFEAISTRGDWMLEGQTSNRAELARRGLYWTADHFEWLYLAATDNPFNADQDPVPSPLPVPDPDPDPGIVDAGSEADAGQRIGTGTDAGILVDRAGVITIALDERGPPSSFVWPAPDAVHPLVSLIPDAANTPNAVARFVGEHTKDPVERAKVLHDWVAERIAYDDAALLAGRYPPQDPSTVFETRRGVCKGYTQLYNHMLGALGIEAEMITGSVRDERANVTGSSHAWTALKIDGKWRLADVTWDSPHRTTGRRSDGTGGAAMKTAEGTTVRADYFLTPPEIFGLDHFPDEPRWQLRDTTLSRGEFARQPMLSPRFHRVGLGLVSPARSQVDAHGEIELVLTNAKGQFVIGHAKNERGEQRDCDGDLTGGKRVHVRCKLPAEGVYQVLLFSNGERFGVFEYVAQLQVTNRI